MPPQGKNKNKKVSQLGGTISGPKSSGRNNGQKRFEEAGESSSSSKQNEETKKVLKGKENVKPKEVPSSSEQSPEIKASNPSKLLVKNFLSVVSGGGDEAILSENSFVAGSGLGIILEESSSIQSNPEAAKASNKRKRNRKNKKENEKKMSPTPEGNKSSELGSSAGSGTISEPETKRCAGEEESGVPCIFKKSYLKVAKRNKMFKEQKEEFENTILQKDEDFKALVKELDGCFEKNKKLKDEIAVTKAELKTVKNKFEKLEKFHFLLEIPHNTVVNIKEMMDLDAEKFYERIYELNIELCHSAGKKKRKVQKKIYKDPRELLDKAEKILADEGDGIFACELIWASFALVMARFFMKWNLNIKSHRALGELAKYTVRFHKKPSARDFLRLFVKDIHNTHRIFYSGKYEIEEVEEYIKDSRKFINYMKAINEIALFADFKYYFPSGDELYREFAQKVYINVINEDICVFGDGPYRFYYQAADTPQTVATQETVKTPKNNSFLHGEATKIKNNEEKINFKNKKRKIRRAMDLKTLENKSKETPKCKIKNGEIYGEEGEEGKKARIMKNRNGFWTQIVHPPSPKERDWVMMTGVEHVIDGVLVCSLSYGGRLVSMGHFWDTLGRLNYYAIMHKFNGPVFLKPEPMTYSELLKEAQENEEVDLALTQLCGQDDDGDGKVYFSTYWERLPGVTTRIWFPGSPESDQQKSIFERDGFRLISLCGYNIKNRTARYVGIWQKSTAKNVSSLNPYEAHYGLTLSECLEINDKLSSRQYVAVQFRVFRSLDEILCCAIWEYLPGHRHWIEIGLNLKQMHQKFSRNIFKSKIVKRENSKLISSSILPRQISHFFDGDGESLRFVVLWSDVNYLRFSREPELWPMGRRIPSTYLNGVESQLQPEKLNFVAKRVERFMRELDIPGLSVAVSKDEKLKYAAGFGYSNIRRGHLVTPDSQFRIGSVSKPITAAAVLLLIDQGRLELDQHVFGPGNSIFGYEFARKKPYEKWVTEITVRHLLEHTAGGWNNIDSDPAWLLPTQNTATLIEKVLIEQPLIAQPGKTWIYSNFGYQLLGYIIERVNIDGFGYEQFVKKYFWEQVGINDIQVARPTLSEKSRREVLYYMAGGNRLGFNPYDLLPAERIGPWGGWIASPIELLRLLIFLDGFKRQEDILSDWAIKEWATPTIASNETYGLGWSLNIMGFNGWQHDGRMPGSASMLVRLDNGISMAVVVNKEYSDRDFFHELGYILHHFGNNCDWWNGTGFDLFGEMEN